MLETGTPRQETRRHTERYDSISLLNFPNVAALSHKRKGASFPYGRGSDTETATYKVNLSPSTVLSALAVSLNTK